jgi:hypothetical protein
VVRRVRWGVRGKRCERNGKMNDGGDKWRVLKNKGVEE